VTVNHRRVLPPPDPSGRRITRTGRVALPAINRAHDAIPFPSDGLEPFGITVLEAMASGLPVISTATGGSGEILRGDVNALVVGAGDAGTTASAVVRLALDQDVEDRFQTAARSEVASRCDYARPVGGTSRREAPCGTPPLDYHAITQFNH
jgi:glycosyltransferase involved in cell wall biosynthesis